MARRARQKGNNGRLATPQSVNAAIESIRDIMRRSNCAGALQSVPELTNETAFVQTKRKLLDEARRLVHRQHARRGLQRRRRRREDEPALLHEGRAHRPHLVLRPLRREVGNKTPFTVDRLEAKGREVAEAIAALRAIGRG